MVDYVKEITMNPKQFMPNPAQVRAYNEGWRAWERTDIPNKDSLCPYPISHPVIGLRQHWFEGLYDNKFSKYSHIPDTDNYANTTNSQAKTKNMGKRRS